jgi:selenocysteine lyase/cysteine desulfurase
VADSDLVSDSSRTPSGAESESEWSDRGRGYLNTASYGLPPRRAFDALQGALADWQVGATSWEPWADAADEARVHFARLVNASPEDVALGSTVSQLLTHVATALPDGARVVVPEIEFTSNLFPWLVQARRGVDVVTVPTGRLAEAIDARTHLVAFSAVQSSTGEVAAVAAVSRAARHHGALVVLDATQAAGWLPVDAQEADVVVCAAYKWLLAPRGAALMVVGSRLAGELQPVMANWWATGDYRDGYYGPPLRLAETARRFDISPAWFSWVGAAPALEVLFELGIDAINAHDVRLANRFREAMGLQPSDSAIVPVAADGAAERLAAAGVRAAVRAGNARLSFHAYNTDDDVDLAVEALTAPAATRRPR